jgi:hypothetical protein
MPPTIHLQALTRHIRIIHQIHHRLRNVFWRTMAFEKGFGDDFF